MIDRLTQKNSLIKAFLAFALLFSLYLIVAWASYSPLDNAWSVASSATDHTLNRTGAFGAWMIDLLFAFFGKVAFVFPFGLAFTSAYTLIVLREEPVSWGDIGIWLFSFVSLLLGLAGLAGVLLPNSSYYLSGGFVGGMLGSLFDFFGQFSVLAISMILACVGFYFCSGQIMLQLFNSLYQWMTEEKAHKSSAEINADLPACDAQDVAQEQQDETSAEQTTETATVRDLSGFDFPFPNITRPANASEVASAPEQATAIEANEALTENVELPTFVVEQPELPKISVPEVALQRPIVGANVENLAQVAATAASAIKRDEPAVFEQPAMPTIRLNPAEPVAVGTAPQMDEEHIVQEAAEPIEPQTAPKVTVAPSFVQSMTGTGGAPISPAAALEEQRPAELTAPRVRINTQDTAEAKAPTYPKGYGSSLIHPLLETKKVLERPTTALPTLDLLSEQKSTVQPISDQEVYETSKRIVQALSDFGVKATVEDVLMGPVVTRYEIKPAAGVKAAKITALDNDLARALVFDAIRITEFVPGKPYMGIETPNSHRETVWLRDVLASEEFRSTKAILPMALGKDISGSPVVVDMAKMPHLLVAGQTGGGKSVGINTMILSLLYKLTPDEVRFIMIDPKVVELSIYNDIPHLLTPVVTDMKKAENALRWAVEEMERRYLLLSCLAVRNIEGYNSKIDQAAEMKLPIPNPLWRPSDSMEQLPPPLEKLPYIVLIVDEFADLMMSAGKQVEDYIMRIAQKARAVGTHLILATQRPSTDVITGVIKANIPSRIAFTVASQIDSRTILDRGGAESLLGRGDMLYSGAGSPELIRVHGAFMLDQDVENVANNWRARGKPEYIDSIVASNEEAEGGSGSSTSGDFDPLFDEIAQFMIDGGATSISGIQRRFSLGFNRAARIIDQLEEQGILSAPDSRGKREVLAR